MVHSTAPSYLRLRLQGLQTSWLFFARKRTVDGLPHASHFLPIEGFVTEFDCKVVMVGDCVLSDSFDTYLFGVTRPLLSLPTVSLTLLSKDVFIDDTSAIRNTSRLASEPTKYLVRAHFAAQIPMSFEIQVD